MEQRELLDLNLNCQYIAQKQSGKETLYRSQCPYGTVAWIYQTQKCQFEKVENINQKPEFDEMKAKFSMFTKYEAVVSDPFRNNP
jgi:hypothetical protein